LPRRVYSIVDQVNGRRQPFVAGPFHDQFENWFGSRERDEVMRSIPAYAFAVLFASGVGLGAVPSKALGADLPAMVPAIGAERVAIIGMTDGLRFSPDTIVIRAGDTVVWQNTSGVPHTVTADPARAGNQANVRLPQGVSPFDSGVMQPCAEFRHTFTVPGEYRYFCQPHEGAGMIGTVIVDP
jgi:plastocyanin